MKKISLRLYEEFMNIIGGKEIIKCHKNFKINYEETLKLIYSSKYSEFSPSEFDFNNIFKGYVYTVDNLKVKIKENNNKSILDCDKYLFDYYFFFILPLSSLILNLYSKKYEPIIIGLQAPQSVGKTTLCNILIKNINELTSNKLNCKSVSIDDYYLTFNELCKLKEENKNMLYRGPPGTHDLGLILELFNNLKNSKSKYYLESFNKALNNGLGDRELHSQSNFVDVKIDILLFEGWFNGIKKSNNIIGDHLEFINKKLENYEEIWMYFDSFISLMPEKYDFSRTWRIETEKINGGMSEEEINKFIKYFWDSIPPNIFFDEVLKKEYFINTFNGKLKPIIYKCTENREFYYNDFDISKIS